MTEYAAINDRFVFPWSSDMIVYTLRHRREEKDKSILREQSLPVQVLSSIGNFIIASFRNKVIFEKYRDINPEIIPRSNTMEYLKY